MAGTNLCMTPTGVVGCGVVGEATMGNRSGPPGPVTIGSTWMGVAVCGRGRGKGEEEEVWDEGREGGGRGEGGGGGGGGGVGYAVVGKRMRQLIHCH